MTDDLFTILVLKVLAGEASAEEQKRLEDYLSTDSDRAGEFKELEDTLSILQATAPLDAALAAAEPALPQYRMQELRTALRREFPSRESKRKGPWWKPTWLQSGHYAAAALAMLVFALTLLNHRAGIEFGTYQDSLMRDGTPDLELRDLSVHAFRTDDVFQRWKDSRFGPQYRIWFDEARDLVVVVEAGGLLSPNLTRTYPLAEQAAQREQFLRELIKKLEAGK